MKVKCLSDNGLAIPTKYRETYCAAETQFPATVGTTYNVYAMGQRVGSHILEYLIVDALGYPYFCPSDLFVIEDVEIPDNWGFNEWKQKDFHYRIWGYPEILKEEHSEGLVLLKRSDIDTFTKARILADSRLWITGEKDIIKELFAQNCSNQNAVPKSISSRKKSITTLTTYFNINGDLLPSMMISGEVKPLNILVNNSGIHGVAYLIQHKGLIIGWELEMLAGDVATPIQSLSIQIL